MKYFHCDLAVRDLAKMADAVNWRTAVDERTGRIYWYHKITRESTWVEPACLREVVPQRSKPAPPRDKHYANLVEVLDGIGNPEDIAEFLRSKLDEERLDGAKLILSTCNPNTIRAWAGLPSMVTVLCNLVKGSCSHSLRLTLLQILWIFASYADVAQVFVGNTAWIGLVQHWASWSNESMVIYCYTVGLLSRGPASKDVSSHIDSPLSLYVRSVLDSDDMSFSLDTLTQPVGSEGSGFLEPVLLRTLCTVGRNGHTVGGLVLVWIALEAMK